jgi:AcrR family transcriptional regulator
MALATSENSRLKRLRIVEGAAALFDERGYHATSMADIAAASGISKPTLYYYFPSKDSILFQIHDELMDLLLAPHAERVAAGESGPLELLRAAIGDLLRVMAACRGHVRVFVEHYRELPDEYRPVVSEKRRQYSRQMTALLLDAQREGVVRELDPEIARLAVFGMCSWVYHWYDPSGPRSIDDIADLLWDLVSQGLLATPPPRSARA